jgi:hypothetical protein
MKLSNNILAGLAAGSLLVAQTASAAALPARDSADIGQSEELGGAPPGSAPVIGLIVLVAIIFGIMALTDSDENGPHSP